MTKLQPLVSSECNWLRESACTCLSLLLPLFAWLVNAHFLLAPPQHTHQCLLADPPPLLCSWCPAWRMTSLKRASLCAKSWRSSFSSTSLASKVGERKEKPLASRVLCVSMLRPGSHWFAQRISLSRSKSKRWTMTCKGQPDSCFFPFESLFFLLFSRHPCFQAHHTLTHLCSLLQVPLRVMTPSTSCTPSFSNAWMTAAMKSGQQPCVCVVVSACSIRNAMRHGTEHRHAHTPAHSRAHSLILACALLGSSLPLPFILTGIKCAVSGARISTS